MAMMVFLFWKSTHILWCSEIQFPIARNALENIFHQNGNTDKRIQLF